MGLDAARWDSLNYIEGAEMKDVDAKARMSLEEKDRQMTWRP